MVESMHKTNLRGVAPFLILALLVAVSYGSAAQNGYVWDDRYFLIDFAWMDSLESAWRTAFSPLFMSEAYVRPLPLLTLYADNLAGSHRATVSHVVNIGIHFSSTCLVYLLARDALRQQIAAGAALPKSALAVAALFAVHPALTEAVVWVSSRFDLFVTLFILGGLWLSTFDRLSTGTLAAGISSLFLLAAFSKELAAVFPPLLAVYIVLRQSVRQNRKPSLGVLLQRRWLIVFAGLLVAGGVYMIVRLHVLSGSVGVSPPAYGTEQFARTCATITRYIQLTLLPFLGNSPQHTFVWRGEESLQHYIPHIIISLLFTAMVGWLALRRSRFGLVLVAWSMGYLLVIHLVPINIGANTVQQRFMYLPTAVLFSLIPYAIVNVPLSDSARRLMPGLIVLLLLASVLVVRSVVPAWKADLSLWMWARKMDPASSVARENLIWAYLDRSMYAEADREVELLSEDGVVTSINAAINVGVSHHHRGNTELALSFYEIAMSKSGGTPVGQRSALLNNMAGAYAILGRDDEARRAIGQAVALDRNNHMALANMLAFCAGRVVDLSEYYDVVVRRAKAQEPAIRQALVSQGVEVGRAKLCPLNQP